MGRLVGGEGRGVGFGEGGGREIVEKEGKGCGGIERGLGWRRLGVYGDVVEFVGCWEGRRGVRILLGGSGGGSR